MKTDRPRFTKNIITRDEALKLAPVYVQFKEAKGENYWKLWDKVWAKFQTLKVGQAVVTCYSGIWLKCKVTSIKSDWRSEDGPVVRVGNGEYTWRVDGDGYAYPI